MIAFLAVFNIQFSGWACRCETRSNCREFWRRSSLQLCSIPDILSSIVSVWCCYWEKPRCRVPTVHNSFAELRLLVSVFDFN